MGGRAWLFVRGDRARSSASLPSAGELPTGGLSGVLRFAAPPPDVPVEIVWKRHVGDGVWLCGAAVVDAAARDWWAFVEVL